MISDPKLPFPSEPAALEAPRDVPREATPGNGTDRPALTAVSSKPRTMAHLWLRRVGVLLFVFVCATLGVMLIIVPWRPEWSDNGLLIPYPALRDVVSNGFVRGVVSGLGVLNVWIGFLEAIQYRED